MLLYLVCDLSLNDNSCVHDCLLTHIIMNISGPGRDLDLEVDPSRDLDPALTRTPVPSLAPSPDQSPSLGLSPSLKVVQSRDPNPSPSQDQDRDQNQDRSQINR